jgi:hypothetical protein
MWHSDMPLDEQCDCHEKEIHYISEIIILQLFMNDHY